MDQQDSKHEQPLSPELDQLAGRLIAMAKKRLEELGQFYPFAAVVRSDGSLVQLTYNPPGHSPLVSKFLDALKDKIREGARHGDFNAAGLCFLAKASCPPDKHISDAICLQLHDVHGQVISYFQPYSHGPNGPRYAPAFRTPGPGSLFPEPSPPSSQPEL